MKYDSSLSPVDEWNIRDLDAQTGGGRAAARAGSQRSGRGLVEPRPSALP